MHPDYTYITQEQNNTRRKVMIVIACIAALFIILLVVALRPKENFEQAWVHKTDLSYDQNFTHLNGSTLYAYNGAVFFATTTEGNTSVLSAKYRLPNPEKIYWANDKGAFLTFSSAFYYSQIEAELKKRGLSLGQGDTRNYTWYLDFATNTFHLVSAEKAELGYYSVKDQGFYYFTGLDGTPRIHFYGLASHKNKIVADAPNAVDISNLSQCTGTIACFVARDKNAPSAMRLYAVKSGEVISQIYDSKGRIFPTNKPDKYVIVETTKKDDYTDESFDEADFPEGSAKLYDAANNSLRGLGFEIGATPVALHMRNDTEFYVFGEQFRLPYQGQEDAPAYLAGRFKSKGDAKTMLKPLLDNSGSTIDVKLIAQLSQGDGPVALLSSADQVQYLFDFNQNSRELRSATVGTADTAIDKCIRSAGLSSRDYYPEERQFRIIFKDTPGFQARIAAFSSCLATVDNAPLIGYTFSFVGVDPVYDRIVTD